MCLAVNAVPELLQGLSPVFQGNFSAATSEKKSISRPVDNIKCFVESVSIQNGVPGLFSEFFQLLASCMD